MSVWIAIGVLALCAALSVLLAWFICRLDPDCRTPTLSDLTDLREDFLDGLDFGHKLDRRRTRDDD